MFKAFTLGLLASALCLVCFESTQAFGGRRRAAQSYADPVPAVAAAPAGTVGTVPTYAPAYTYPTQAPAYQQYRPYPYQAGPRTQGPSYAYPNSDPRRFNFQYNH